MSETTQEQITPTLEDMFATGEVTTAVTPQETDIFFEEKKDEETPPTTKEPEIPETKIETPVGNDFYSDLIKDFIEEGDWEDGQVEIDGEKILLSELKNVSKDVFSKLKQGQKNLKAEKDKGKYISTEDLDENDIKLIELRKLGGDVRELLQYSAEIVHPLEGLDLEDINIQRNIVYHKYKAQGLSDKVITNVIKELESDFKLDAETAECVEQINKSYTNMVDAKLEAKKEEVKKLEEDTKVYRKNLNETYKEFGLKDTVSKNLIDAATIRDKQGLTKTDSLYFKAKADPEFYSKLNLFLNDPKGFEEFLGAKVKNKTALDTFITISTVDKKATNTAQEKVEKTDDNWADFYPKK